MNFTMTKPCPSCPFRTDIRPFLKKARAREICDALIRQQQTFQCHKTIEYGEDDEDMNTRTTNAQHCAGALILLEKLERPNQMMRIAERLGGYDMRKLDMEAPIFDTPQQFIKAQSK